MYVYMYVYIIYIGIVFSQTSLKWAQSIPYCQTPQTDSPVAGFYLPQTLCAPRALLGRPRESDRRAVAARPGEVQGGFAGWDPGTWDRRNQFQYFCLSLVGGGGGRLLLPGLANFGTRNLEVRLCFICATVRPSRLGIRLGINLQLRGPWLWFRSRKLQTPEPKVPFVDLLKC